MRKIIISGFIFLFTIPMFQIFLPGHRTKNIFAQNLKTKQGVKKQKSGKKVKKKKRIKSKKIVKNKKKRNKKKRKSGKKTNTKQKDDSVLLNRIDFGNSYIMGQSIKSGAVYLLKRKKSEIKSMLDYRTNYRKEILEDFAIPNTGKINKNHEINK